MKWYDIVEKVGLAAVVATGITVAGSIINDGPSDCELAHQYVMDDELNPFLSEAQIERLTSAAVRKLEECYE
ncbi:MAG: hypothetical protein WA979_09710 [Pacificimonas sp.]